MTGFLDVLSAIAHVAGGTQPDPFGKPYWYSGKDTGDSTGVTGLSGCWAVPDETLADTPIGLVLPGSWRLPNDILTQGMEYNEDDVILHVLVNRSPIQAQLAILAPFRDSVPVAFRGHMTAFGVADALALFASSGRFIEQEWGGQEYLGLEFTIRVQRAPHVTYTA